MASSLPTSGTYNFLSITIELIIREAFELIGIVGEFVVPEKLITAKNKIDLILIEWNIRTVNLWTLKTEFLTLLPGKKDYLLADIVNDVSQMSLRTYTTPLGGTPSSNDGNTYAGYGTGGGIASNAFDGNPATSCLQTVGGGNISYDYGQNATQIINFIGVTSQINRTYNLVVEVSVDPNPNPGPATWSEIARYGKLTFTAGTAQWLEIPIASQQRAYRIRETDADVTLNIQEIYFANNITDYPLSTISRQEYLNYPNKFNLGRPTTYYFNKQISPILNIWPLAESNQYNCIQYSYTQMIQSTGSYYTNTLEIPARFYPTLIMTLAYRLALQYKADNPGAIAELKAQAEQLWQISNNDDSEINQTSTIYPNFEGYMN